MSTDIIFGQKRLLRKKKEIVLKKTAILIFIGCVCIFSACDAARLAARDKNQAATHGGGKISSADSERSGKTSSGETSVSANDVTGVYQSKDADHFNEFKIEDDGNDRLKVEFMGLYESRSETGMSKANTDQTDVLTATIEGNTAIVKIPGYPKCRYTLVFEGEELNVRRDGTIMDCNLGGQIAPEGVYRRVSGRTPVFGEWFEEEKSVPEAKSEKRSKNAQAAGTIRVRLAKGSNSATLSGEISNGREVFYVLEARKGQTLEFEVTEGGAGDDVVAEVFAADGENLTGEDYGAFWSGRLPRDGDYIVKVGTIETENTEFKVQITIR